ncbi:MAG: bifunctional precorrin-2 dehydrogenase/sirohydrochlorin ferrochelatase [Deltaproteobacteria bacterium]|nr:MAG: bifunctional precorrin-2 dehydrogenase/sirohydrochlorin ferrochelatase [Deltaproteobacteria bacterium]
MRYYPVFLDLNHKRALVVGGGLVAQRKVETLVNYGASISVISRELTGRLEEMAAEGILQYLGPEFRDEYLEGVFLVIAATDDPMLNHQVSQRAQERGLLINAVDQPEDCNFIVPAIMSRGDLQIAISTSGKSPALAGKIRQQMEVQFGEEYERLLFLMGRIRKEVLSRGLPQKENKSIFKKIIDSGILEALAEKDRERVEMILKSALGNQVDQETLDLTLGSEAC